MALSWQHPDGSSLRHPACPPSQARSKRCPAAPSRTKPSVYTSLIKTRPRNQLLLLRHAQLQGQKDQEQEPDDEASEEARVPQERHHIRVQGLVRSIRKQSRVAFAHVQDGSTYRPIQAVLSPELAANLTNGAYVDYGGPLAEVASQRTIIRTTSSTHRPHWTVGSR